MIDPLKPYYETIAEMKAKGLYTTHRVVESPQGSWLKVDGKRVLNFCSNNYLGFASDKRLIDAAIRAVRDFGIGPGAVRPLSGNLKLHVAAEEALARFKHAEAAFLLSGGFIANIVAIQTIMGKEDIVISDELNHASIIDAIKIAQVKNKFIYKHSDMKDLERVLQEAAKLAKGKKADGTHPIIMITTDGVFSMDGDIAKLPAIVRLAKKYGAITMVDDAHGEGVLGGGRGIVHHFNLHGKGRPFLFSTGLTVADTAAIIEAVKVLTKSASLVNKLWDNAEYLKKGFKRLGFDTGVSETPITPVMLGDENLAKNFSAKLFENGVFATPIKYPMVALGKARIRVMPSASHSKKDLDFGLAAFSRVGRELKVLKI